MTNKLMLYVDGWLPWSSQSNPPLVRFSTRLHRATEEGKLQIASVAEGEAADEEVEEEEEDEEEEDKITRKKKLK